MRGIGASVTALIALLCGAGARAAGPFALETTPGRLPKDVLPLEYRVQIVPDPEHLSTAGTESVWLEVRSATSRLEFNSLNERLSDVRLDGRPVSAVATDDARELTTVTLPHAAPAGRHRLSFRFTGRIETDPHGLFLQRYRDPAGNEHRLLSTQMEATDARRMFPCWDEPAFRAVFRLETTQSADWAVVSNMPLTRRRVTGTAATTRFAASPRMPSYLVAYTAGDLAAVTAASRGVRFGVWAVRGREADGAEALANAQLILGDYDDYFGYPFPLPKLDSLAIPGGFPGAMENWGAISYSERILLLGSTSTGGERQAAFATQAHEMAHQWNGDLVTMAWWDDIWLNESFASWMAGKETAQRHPEWQWREEEDLARTAAMNADAHLASHAIQQHVTNELEAMTAFDTDITYSKGESILRMFEAYLGPEVFRRGVQGYIRAHAFSNATTTDLWRALGAESSGEFGTVAAGWTDQAGFPLVTATAQCDATGARTLHLEQRRFLLDGPADVAGAAGAAGPATHWDVPLWIRSGVDAPPTSVLFKTPGQVVAAGRCEEPLSLDADAIGFYRVAYDPATFALDAGNFARLPDGDRIALLDDQWALVEARQAPLASYLELAAAMGTSIDVRAWQQIATALETIEYAERGSPGHDAFLRRGRALLAPVLGRLGFDPGPQESPSLRRLRRTLITDLGAWADPQVLAAARARFAAFREDEAAIAPDEQSAIFAVVAQHADAATFEELDRIARSAVGTAQMRRDYSALMQVPTPELAARAAAIALSPQIPPQADLIRLSLIAELARRHPELAWRTFTEHAERLLAANPSFAPMVITLRVPDIFWNGIPLAELEAWEKTHAPADAANFMARGLDTVRFRLTEKTDLIRQADALGP